MARAGRGDLFDQTPLSLGLVDIGIDVCRRACRDHGGHIAGYVPWVGDGEFLHRALQHL